ncbi:MAG: septum formation initiator family protein [Bacteroidales bacterium]|nr:septum formation initiator family protein [Bacteroidales bacterium]
MYDNGKPIEEVKEHYEDAPEGFKKYITQRNIIIALCVGFVLLIAFFDRNSLIQRNKLKKEQEKLIETKKNLIEDISKTQKEIDALDENEYIEQIARERYLMKKDNEDIYIVTD